MSVIHDVSRVETFARMRHAEFLRRAVVPGADAHGDAMVEQYAEPDGMGSLAASMARVHAGGAMLSGLLHERSVDDDADEVAIARRSGLLRYGIDRYGMTFESLVDVAGSAVAGVVSALSGDPRRPHPRRLQELKSQLLQAGEISQIVILAEFTIVAGGFIRRGAADEAFFASYGPAVRRWAEGAAEILPALKRLRSSPCLRPACVHADQQVATLLSGLSKPRGAGRREAAASVADKLRAAAAAPPPTPAKKPVKARPGAASR